MSIAMFHILTIAVIWFLYRSFTLDIEISGVNFQHHYSWIKRQAILIWLICLFTGRFRCDSELTSKLVVANSSPFREVDTLGVIFYGDGHYRMMNRTSNPYIQFVLPKSLSILQVRTPKISLQEDDTVVIHVLGNRSIVPLPRTTAFWTGEIIVI